jgi:hypothetical protein
MKMDVSKLPLGELEEFMARVEKVCGCAHIHRSGARLELRV